FGLPALPPEEATPWLRLKGIRDLTTGIVAVTLLLLAPPTVVGWILLAYAIIPVGDAAIVLAARGDAKAAWDIHVATAVIMIIGAIFLLSTCPLPINAPTVSSHLPLVSLGDRLQPPSGVPAFHNPRRADPHVPYRWVCHLDRRHQPDRTIADRYRLEYLARTYIDFCPTGPSLVRTIVIQPTGSPFTFKR